MPSSPPAPALPRQHVRREALTGAVLGSPGRVVTVVAPTGYGKSTTLLEIRACSRRPTIYVPLGPEHREPLALWGAVVKAASAEPRIPVGELARLASPNPPPVETALRAWLGTLDDIDGAPVLMLDDLHRAWSHAIVPGLSLLLERGAGLCVVLASRVPVDLPVGKLRAQGELMEVGMDALAFDLGETRAALALHLGDALAAEVAPTIFERTEGWPAGVQLAALAMRGHPDPRAWLRRFDGSDRTVSDLLADEVWGGIDPPRQRALEALAVVSAFDGETAAALTGAPDGGAFIAALEDDGLFVTPGPAPGWHRLHPLFATFLAAQLQRRGPAEARATRLAAARWLAPRRPAEAFDLAWRAGALDEARHILETSAWDRISQSDVEAVARDVQRLGLPVDAMGPALLINACWAWFLSNRQSRMEEGLNHLGRLEAAGGLSALVLCQLENLRAGMARQRGDILDSIRHARRALSLVPADEPSLKGSTALYLGIALHFFGRHGEACEAFTTCIRSAPRDEPVDIARATAWGMYSQALCAQGAFGAADRALAPVEAELRGMVGPGGGPPEILGFILMERGRIAFELGEVAEAEALLAEGLALAEVGGLGEVVQVGRIAWARGLRMVGRLDEARQQLERLEIIRAREPLSVWVELRYVAERIVHAVKAGRLTEAGILMESQRDFLLMPPSLNNEELILAGAVHTLATGGYGLTDQLTPLRRGAKQMGRRGLELRATLFEVSLAAPKDPETARRKLRAALDLAQRERHRLPFAEVTGAQASLREAAHSLRDLGQRVFAGQLVAWLDGLSAPPQGPAEDGAAPTGREGEILALIAEGRSNDEIAAALHVSLSTVKTHLRNLYRKLEVKRRSQAVAVARERGLLP